MQFPSGAYALNHFTSGTGAPVDLIYGIGVHYPLLFRHRALIFQHNNVHIDPLPKCRLTLHYTSGTCAHLCTQFPVSVPQCSQYTPRRLDNSWFYWLVDVITVILKAYLKKFLMVKNVFNVLHFERNMLKGLSDHS
jgi:hypothetical protein